MQSRWFVQAGLETGETAHSTSTSPVCRGISEGKTICSRGRFGTCPYGGPANSGSNSTPIGI